MVKMVTVMSFIFARSADANPPTLPDDDWGFDEPESPWGDTAPNLNNNNPYLWFTFRRVPGSPATGTTVMDDWRMVRILSRFGPAGTDGSDGSDGSDGNDGIAGANGDDGNGYEWIFTRTNTANMPSAPSNSWGFDNPQSPWTDAAPNISASMPYLWRSSRRVEGVPPFNSSVSDNWNSARIVGRFGLTGQNGINGLEGADGTDGDDGSG